LPSVFGQLVRENLGLWYLARFPVRARCSDARVLDRQTAIVAVCEPAEFRRLVREWHDRRTSEELAEAVHQLELERAAQPPVIEVTVITPPGGISRLELARAVAGKVAEIAGPLPALSPASLSPASLSPVGVRQPGRRQVLVAARRRLAARDGPGQAALPVSEDDTPTQVLPSRWVIAPEYVEVRVP